MTDSQSPLDRPDVINYIENLLLNGESNATVVRHIERTFSIRTTDDSIRRFKHRHKIQLPKAEPSFTHRNGSEADCQTPPSNIPPESDPDTMLRERGLDPEDWYIDAIRANKWGSEENPSYQTRFTAKVKRPYQGIMPARMPSDWVAPEPTKHDMIRPELVVICGDQQAPYHDKNLHRLFCDWLDHNRPDHGVILGDLGDYPEVSRHPKDPENHAKTNECIQASTDILYAYRRASVNTTWDYLMGNHDERLRQYLLNNAPEAWGWKQADLPDSDGVAIHKLNHLLRLDELKINLIEPHGTYEHAQVELSKNLAVRHGWIAQQGSGKSALVTLNQTGYSTIMGHTHRQSVVYKSQPEIDGTLRTTTAVEAGCMCRIDARGVFDEKGRRYPNYGAGHPDWQQGFVTASIHPDGKFNITIASYVNGVLLYADQRYE